MLFRLLNITEILSALITKYTIFPINKFSITDLDVSLQLRPKGEPLSTLLAFMGFFTTVYSHMPLSRIFKAERLVTFLTLKSPLL